MKDFHEFLVQFDKERMQADLVAMLDDDDLSWEDHLPKDAADSLVSYIAGYAVSVTTSYLRQYHEWLHSD